MDVIYVAADEAGVPEWRPPEPVLPDPAQIEAAGSALAAAQRPVVIAGTDVWFGQAEQPLRDLVETTGVPLLLNGMGRGLVPADSPQVIARARGAALAGADLVVVVGTPLDFRLGFGRFGSARVVHVADSPEGIAGHVELAASVAGDLAAAVRGVTDVAGGPTGELAAVRRAWLGQLRDVEASKRAAEVDLLEADTDPIHPVRVYGELGRVLDRDAVVIGDGGDFVSFAGRYVRSSTPGRWLDPGPYGCLGTGMGYAVAGRLAHPDAQVVALLGDGAAGFSLMDADTLVRHDLPVVMVVGNNGMWALEKYPMQALYGGWDAAADLQPGLRYDDVVRALGGAGETVERAADLRPALDRAFASGVPYLVNVLTDPSVAYPRSTALA
jgi:acetolactate synthase-1/2/3 large subunit